MATKINTTPTNDVNFDPNATFDEDFSKWLTEMVAYWPKYYTGCTFQITKVISDTNGLSVEISSQSKPNVQSDCKSNLYNSCKDAKNITVISTESKNKYSVVWKKESTSEKITDKKETKKKGDGENGLDPKKPNKYINRLFGTAASNILGGVTAGLKGSEESGVENSHYVSDKKLVEEIERIKELLK
jgi:hypothetical protein